MSTSTEIEKIESLFETSLPQFYKNFLTVYGYGGFERWTGSDYTFGWLSSMKHYANELLLENGLDVLPEEAFVFLMHQGYQFSFFIGDKPEIYYYNECYGMENYQKVSDSFEKFTEDYPENLDNFLDSLADLSEDI